MKTDRERLELYKQILAAARACRPEAARLEASPPEVPADLQDDESPPFPPTALAALDRLDELVRRVEVTAPDDVVRLAGHLSLEATQLIAYAIDQPMRARRQQLRDSLTEIGYARRLAPEAELAQQVAGRYEQALADFVRGAGADLGSSGDELQ